MLQQAISISLLAAMASIPPAASQGIARTASISGNVPSGPPATRVLVATPYPSALGDSVAAVAIGDALRNKLSNSISSNDWLVISRQEMNRSLTTWGYSRDQLFPPESARQMVSAMQARMFVMTTLTKSADGRFVATSRITGSSDDAGHVTKLTQVAGQTPQDFGNKIAEQLKVIFSAYPDAMACRDQQRTNKPKAVEGANKALKAVPGYGFAEYCLGEMEQLKDSVGAETERHFRNAMAGDPLSLKAVNQIAFIHYKKNDTTAVVNDYLKMLQIAPTNRELADQAVKTFRGYNRPDAAAAVVDTQMKLDPSSPDWPELKGNLCAAAALGAKTPAEAKDNFKCAYDAFMRVYELDITRADTLYYPRMVFVAGNRADSMLWVKRWIDKFSSNADAYSAELQMYMDAGQVDSATGVVKILSAIDPTNAKPTLGLAQAMINAKQPEAALQFVGYFKKAEENPRNQYAGLLINVVQTMAQQTPRPDSSLVLFGQAIVDVAPTAPNFLIYGNYFMAIGLADMFKPLSDALRAAKTCENAKAEDALLARFEPALNVAATSSNENISTAFAKAYLASLPAEKTFVAQVITQGCKP